MKVQPQKIVFYDIQLSSMEAVAARHAAMLAIRAIKGSEKALGPYSKAALAFAYNFSKLLEEQGVEQRNAEIEARYGEGAVQAPAPPVEVEPETEESYEDQLSDLIEGDEEALLQTG